MYLRRQTRRHPRFLYRYRPIAQGRPEDLERLQASILESKHWVSAPDDFNDPFDMKGRLRVEGDAEAVRRRVNDIGKTNGMRWKQRKKLVDTIMAMPRSELTSAMSTALEDHRRRLGVLSLSTDPRSILMWSHYATNHTGVCLVLDVAADPSSLLMSLPVTYTDTYPELDWVGSFETDIQKALLYKFSDWAYEQERRIIVKDGARTFLRTVPSALNAIILGTRTTDDSIRAIQTTLERRLTLDLPSVKLYRAMQHTSRYQIRLQRL